jgi:hypothetical protein
MSTLLIASWAAGNANSERELHSNTHARFGYDKSELSNFFQCTTAALGKRVIVYEYVDSKMAGLDCSPEGKQRWLHQLNSIGHTVLSSQQWAVIIDSDWLNEYHWSVLDIQTEVNDKGASPLPKNALDALKEDLLSHVLYFPAVPVLSSFDQPRVLRYRFVFDVFQQRFGSKDGVVVLLHLGEEGNMDPNDISGRVIFGTLDGGHVALQWQSPVVETNGIVQFKDVNADGFPEILVWSRWIENAKGLSWQTLSIFDQDGNELTRQKDCEFEGDTNWLNGTACPVVGTEVSIISTVSPALITYWGGPKEEKNAVLKLRNGRYVRVTQPARAH